MSLPIIKLKQQKPERLRHPWIYDNEISQGPPAGFLDGGLVHIVDWRGKSLGTGYLNSCSKIAVRYLTRDNNEIIDEAFWKKRIASAMQYRRERYRGHGGLPKAYRLSHGETDGLPGLVVDVYDEIAVVQFLARGLEQWRSAIISGIRDAAGVVGIYERSDSAVRRLEGLEEQAGSLWGKEPPEVLEYEDDGAIVLVDIKNGGKTGLFLDQRDNQRAAAAEAEGRSVLNCFSYTGLFSLRSALRGAKSVIDVEASGTFNGINARQWERNRLTVPHEIIEGNVFDYLRIHEKAGDRFDLIVLDPPAFTKNRASREGAARGYNEINRMGFRMLNRDGILVTCSCSHHMSLDEFRSIVEKAANDANRTVRLISQRGQPPDHPVLLNAPESEYLKCLIMSVE